MSGYLPLLDTAVVQVDIEPIVAVIPSKDVILEVTSTGTGVPISESFTALPYFPGGVLGALSRTELPLTLVACFPLVKISAARAHQRVSPGSSIPLMSFSSEKTLPWSVNLAHSCIYTLGLSSAVSEASGLGLVFFCDSLDAVLVDSPSQTSAESVCSQTLSFCAHVNLSPVMMSITPPQVKLLSILFSWRRTPKEHRVDPKQQLLRSNVVNADVQDVQSAQNVIGSSNNLDDMAEDTAPSSPPSASPPSSPSSLINVQLWIQCTIPSLELTLFTAHTGTKIRRVHSLADDISVSIDVQDNLLKTKATAGDLFTKYEYFCTG